MRERKRREGERERKKRGERERGEMVGFNVTGSKVLLRIRKESSSLSLLLSFSFTLE